MDLGDVAELIGAEDRTWTLVAAGSAAVVGLSVRLALKTGWRLWKGEDPPNDPHDHRVDWRDAATWAVVSGAVVGLGRVVARRGAAAGYERIRGRRPPG